MDKLNIDKLNQIRIGFKEILNSFCGKICAHALKYDLYIQLHDFLRNENISINFKIEENECGIVELIPLDITSAIVLYTLMIFEYKEISIN